MTNKKYLSLKQIRCMPREGHIFTYLSDVQEQKINMRRSQSY